MAKSPKRKDYLKDYKQGESGKYEYSGDAHTMERREIVSNKILNISNY